METRHSLILRTVKQTRIVRHISFTYGRFSAQKLKRHIPEIFEMNTELGFKSNNWAQRMDDHNEILRRGESMRMHPIRTKSGIKSLTFLSLDRYILQMHSHEIICILNALSKFAERVIKVIHQDQAARVWQISDQILIQRRHWFALARHVMNLLKLIGFEDVRMRLGSGMSAWHSPWPDFDLLAAAASRAAGHYGRFGAADTEYARI